MLRFIDVTDEYWTDPSCGHPICCFLSTSDDRFLTNESGGQTFSDAEEIAEHVQGERMLGLMPPGFFSRNLEEEYDDKEFSS